MKMNNTIAFYMFFSLCIYICGCEYKPQGDQTMKSASIEIARKIQCALLDFGKKYPEYKNAVEKCKGNIHEDKDGTIWIGLWIFDPKSNVLSQSMQYGTLSEQFIAEIKSEKGNISIEKILIRQAEDTSNDSSDRTK
jgi:hypothetical protein